MARRRGVERLVNSRLRKGAGERDATELEGNCYEKEERE